jgi:hypothetical protein
MVFRKNSEDMGGPPMPLYNPIGMARNWQYPRWRRLLMQSAMWVILGGTVGLAALLDRHQHQEMRINLTAPMQVGGVRLRLPSHWMIEYSDAGMVTASESNADPFMRALQVTVAPPAELGLVDQLLRRQDPTAATQAVAFGSGAKSAGNLYVWEESVDQDGQSFPFVRVIATAVLSNGPEVTIRLEHLARNAASMDVDDDIDLLRRIAGTVEVAPGGVVPEQD